VKSVIVAGISLSISAVKMLDSSNRLNRKLNVKIVKQWKGAKKMNKKMKGFVLLFFIFSVIIAAQTIDYYEVNLNEPLLSDVDLNENTLQQKKEKLNESH